MTDKAVKVGDVVAWDDVPSGAMVRDHESDIAVRVAVDGFADDGSWVKGPVTGNRIFAWRPDFLWADASHGFDEDTERVTIIALGLTGNETADELRALAEAFERDHPAA